MRKILKNSTNIVFKIKGSKSLYIANSDRIYILPLAVSKDSASLKISQILTNNNNNNKKKKNKKKKKTNKQKKKTKKQQHLLKRYMFLGHIVFSKQRTLQPCQNYFENCKV